MTGITLASGTVTGMISQATSFFGVMLNLFTDLLPFILTVSAISFALSYVRSMIKKKKLG